MNDWADAMAARIKAREQDRRLKDTKFVEVQRIRRAKAGPLWEDVRSHVRQNCDDLNKKMGQEVLTFEVVPSSEISVRAQQGSLHAEFDAEGCVLSWSCGTKTGRSEVVVHEDGTVAWGHIPSWETGVPATAASIATERLTAVLGF